MKSKRLLLLLLMALIAPWAMNAQNSIPFNEGFENMTSVDDLTAAGWTLSTTESGTFLAIETSASNVYEGTKSLNLDAWDASSSSSVQYLGLPLVAGDLNTLQISFAYKVTSGTINVGYLTDATDFSTFTSLAQYSSSSSFTVVSTDLSEAPSDAARLVLKYTGWYRCYLDNFEVKVLPSCQAATNITARDITATSATIAWEGEGDTWNLKYNGIEVNGISAMSYNLTGLTDGTNYTVSVQNVCSDGSTTDWISTTFRTPEICPDGKICIGEGTTTSTYLPANNYYDYSLSQQIYTADEIGEAGAILSIDFFKASTITMAVDLDIYMVLTEKDEFESTTDFIPVTASNLVYSGTVTFADNAWTTIELDNPFVYDGTSNVAIMVDNNTGDYVSSTPFYVFNSDKNQALYAQRDGTNYDPFAPSFSSRTAQKNRIRLAIGEPPACPKPTGLAVNYEGGTSATFTWTENGTATSWDLQYSTDAEFNEYTSAQVDGTPSYELTGLELATTYYVRVNAFCEAPSEYSTTISFTTDACMPEDQCALTFVVTDSYGDGWNGASIQIYDYTGEELGDLLATVTNENLDGTTGAETQTITLNFCNGQELAIVWVEGGYDDECSYTITDLNGDVVVEGSGEGFDGFAYTMDCSVTDCRKPTDFAASEIANHSVVLSWTENGPATEWVIAYISENDEEISYITTSENPYTLTGLDPETMYAAQVTPVCEVEKPSEVIYWTTDVACPKPFDMNVTPYPFTANVEWSGYAEAYEIEWAEVPASEPESKDPYNEEGWYYYDNGTYYGSVGLGGGEFHWGIMLPAGSYEGNTIDVVKAYDINAMVGTLAIYNDGETAPANQLSIQDMEFTGIGDWVEFDVNVTVDPSKNVWIVFDAVDGAAYPMGTSYVENGDANGRWVEISGTWYDMNNVGVSNRANMIRAHFEAINYDEYDWTTVSGITSPYTIEGLQPETTYIVRVKALCGGEDGESAWTTMTFTTPSACDMPIDLVAEDITYNSATLNWTGYQNSYNVKYRQVPHGEVYASANFDDNSMGEWTTIDADGDGYDWVLGSECGGIYLAEGGSLAGSGHNASADLVTSGSYSNVTSAALTPDNYLVSPQVTLGGTITFWACAQDASYAAEHFGVAVSTTGNTDAADFTTIQEWTMTAKGGNRGNVSKLVVGGGAKTEPVATTRSGENLRAGNWYQFTVDLSAYSGQGYVAIRHFDCTDYFMLNVDDIVIEGVAPAIEWTTVTVTEPTLAITGLTPETEYEWQVQGINASCGELEWIAGPTFTTLEQTTVTQTIALSAGPNWFSTYVDITLDDLKAALVSEAPANSTITIKSATQNTVYSRGRWNGTLDWDVANMYIIIVPAECEITLEGMPLNPEEHPITIVGNGNPTWIGFPYSNSMTVTAAFDGFAVNGDIIKSSNNNSQYSRGRWNGSVTNLEPGHGYIYVSAPGSSDRTFVYPSAR